MAEVDTSIYNRLQPAPSPLQTVGSVAQTLGALNQNRLFQQQYNANLAASAAAKSAVDPQTGLIDTAKYSNALANGPAAYKLPEFLQQAQQMQQGQLGIDKTKLDIATQANKNVNDALGSLLSLRDASGNFTGTQKDVIGRIGELVSQGSIPMQSAISQMQSLPQGGPELQQWLTQHMVMNMDSQARIQALYGTPQAVNTGGQTNFIAASPLGGVRNMGAVANTLSPGESASRIPVAANGVQGTAPLSSLVTPTGQAPVAPGQQPPMGAPASNVPVAASPGGAQPGQPQMAPQAPLQAAQGGPIAPPGFVQSQLAPGVADAAQVQARESAEQGVALQKSADTVPQQKALLGNLESALTQFTSGGGADWKRMAKTFVNSNSPFGNLFDPKTIASQEEFNKQATQLAQSQFQALGGTGTDAKLDSAMHTSPNEALSGLGNKNIISLLKGNADAIGVKNQEWQTYLQNGGGPQDYGKFSTQFNKAYDPRVFQATYMSPQDRQQMLKGMNKSEVDNFRKSYNLAVTKGWIPDPRQANGAQQ